MLQGQEARLNTFAGEAVVIRGKARKYDTVLVESVTPAIVEVFRPLSGG
jgi:hypothetical protein